ncbi:protein of unknown function [Rhodovastum atsumiense]|nr:protein of unknown function [Rhodovastum atsumiense]
MAAVFAKAGNRNGSRGVISQICETFSGQHAKTCLLTPAIEPMKCARTCYGWMSFPLALMR